MTTDCFTTIESPVGELLLASDGERLTRLDFQGGPKALRPQPGWRRAAAPFTEARRQLRAYFGGELREFGLRLAPDPEGTPFQREVWEQLRKIPYGTTLSYGELAARLGRPKASRAVGMANGANRIAIVIPCHRVIGADGSLTGFGGGLPIKRRLLDLES